VSPIARRQYSNVSQDTTLNGAILSGATSLIVTSATGYPTAPFMIVVDANTASEELILVGAKSGTTFSSLTRGADGTSAAGHSSGAAVAHVVSATDIDEFDGHRWDTPAVAADTDVAASSIHHTLGTGATQAATGNHAHGTTGLTFSGARVFRNAGLSLVNNTLTAISWDSESFDPGGLHSGSSSQVTLNTVGYWLVMAAVGFQADATGYRQVSIIPNAVSGASSIQSATGATSDTYVPLSVIVQATAVTDYYEVKVKQTSGGNLAIVAGQAASWTACTYLGT